MLARGALFLEGHVVDGYVDLGYLEAGEAFDAPDHVPPHRLSNLVDGPAVSYVHRQVHRGLVFAHLDGDATDPPLPAGDVAQELPDGGGRVSRHPDSTVGGMDPLDLLDCDRRDARHHRILDSRRTIIAL